MVFAKILVAIDGSKYSDKALNVAIELSRKFNATLYIMHVIEKPPVLTVVKSQEEIILKALKEHADRLLAKALLKAENKGVDTKLILEEGKPGPKIREAAEKLGIDLIVVGSRGLGTISKFILGSVSDFLVRRCVNKAVLIVR